MIDREKVLKGLECCAAMGGYECQKCPYRHECLDNDLPYGMPHLAADALALLKEQEPKTVLRRDDGYYCPRCSTITTRAIGVQKLHLGTSYCPYCGQAVKWDAE